jgi:hypothetical protein
VRQLHAQLGRLRVHLVQNANNDPSSEDKKS